MSYQVVYSHAAGQDLRDIYSYIRYELKEPGTARKMTERIMEAVRGLESLPGRNPLYKEEPWHSRGLRFMPVKNYLVFYTVDETAETVAVARIIYGGRDLRRQLVLDE